MDVYLNGTRIKLDPSKSKGKGGEADIFQIQSGIVAKIFKFPDHPDLENMPLEQTAARLRIIEHQKKLRTFPKTLPQNVIIPQDLLTDASGQQIVGYTMKFINGSEPLFHYSEKAFRQTGIDNNKMVTIFQDLHKSVDGVHAHRDNVVIGDFNDLNVLVVDKTAYIIDADSFQYGHYICKMFTTRFVDPLLCDPKGTSLMMVKMHNQNSDWYAFTIMVMQCLLFVHPYGGIYIPKDPKKRIPQDSRALQHITIFNPEVRYPKPATPYKVLPDNLLNHFYNVFEKDCRGIFPFELIDNLQWTTCPNCGMEHARNSCPNCAIAPTIAIATITTIRGTVTAIKIFQTKGVILFATMQSGKVRWIYHESNQFKRENGKSFLNGELDPYIRYRIQGDITLLGKGNDLITINEGTTSKIIDFYGNLPVFDANENNQYWIESGKLMRNGTINPEFIGDVLTNQTLFWVGNKFGFGFYRAGNLNVAFIFDTERKGINDNVKLPQIKGQLIDSTCIFTNELCWFFISTQQGSNIINQCYAINQIGEIIATAQAKANDNTWLSEIRGKCAISNFLFSTSDNGLIRLEIQNGQIIQTREFPDTEPFIDTNSHIFAGKEGLYVVKSHEILQLKIG
jgi:H/ACA ribonucleoprotein complex subunit 3